MKLTEYEMKPNDEFYTERQAIVVISTLHDNTGAAVT